MSTNHEFWLLRNGETTGPHPADSITQMLFQGEASREDLACPVGGTEWKPLAQEPLFAKNPTTGKRPLPLPTKPHITSSVIIGRASTPSSDNKHLPTHTVVGLFLLGLGVIGFMALRQTNLLSFNKPQPQVAQQLTVQDFATSLQQGGILLQDSQLGEIIHAVKAASRDQHIDIIRAKAVMVAFFRAQSDYINFENEDLARFCDKLYRAFPSNSALAMVKIDRFLKEQVSLRTKLIKDQDFPYCYRVALAYHSDAAQIIAALVDQ